MCRHLFGDAIMAVAFLPLAHVLYRLHIGLMPMFALPFHICCALLLARVCPSFCSCLSRLCSSMSKGLGRVCEWLVGPRDRGPTYQSREQYTKLKLYGRREAKRIVPAKNIMARGRRKAPMPSRGRAKALERARRNGLMASHPMNSIHNHNMETVKEVRQRQKGDGHHGITKEVAAH